MLAVLKKNKKTILIFTIYFIAIFIFNFFRPLDMDLIWNYGFSKNVSDGLIMYKDFNMVITPFYPAITGLLMKIFSTNLIFFYIINTFYALLTLIIVYKLDKKLFFHFLFIFFLILPQVITLYLYFTYFY